MFRPFFYKTKIFVLYCDAVDGKNAHTGGLECMPRALGVGIRCTVEGASPGKILSVLRPLSNTLTTCYKKSKPARVASVKWKFENWRETINLKNPCAVKNFCQHCIAFGVGKRRTAWEKRGQPVKKSFASNWKALPYPSYPGQNCWKFSFGIFIWKPSTRMHVQASNTS